MAAKQTTGSDAELEFVRLAEKLSRDPRVDPPEMARGKGFGSKGLKVGRKMFAFSSKGRLVVKLPAARVDALASSGEGTRFDPGRGRLMKEWIAFDLRARASWPRVAHEALEFASASTRGQPAPGQRTPKRSQKTRRRP